MVQCSVCIPVYNGEKFLDRALQSAISQEFDDLEIIVSDDGSSDSSLSIAYKYAAQDPRVKVISNPTPGMIRNWKNCIEQSCGSYFTMLMQDDWLEPDFVGKLMALAKGECLCAVTSLAYIRDANANLREIYYPQTFLEVACEERKAQTECLVFSGKQFLNAFVGDFRNGFVKFNMSLTLISRKHYNQCGGIDLGLKYCADAFLFLQLAQLYDSKFGFMTSNLLSHLTGYGDHRVSSSAGVIVRYHDVFAILERLRESKAISVEQFYQIRDFHTKELVKSGWSLLDSYSVLRNTFGYWLALRFSVKMVFSRVLRRGIGIFLRSR
jgi:glycosyltransferase involved in cell wall biosynthesis